MILLRLKGKVIFHLLLVVKRNKEALFKLLKLEEIGGGFALLKPQIKLSTIPLLKSCQEISGSVRLLSGMPFPKGSPSLKNVGSIWALP